MNRIIPSLLFVAAGMVGVLPASAQRANSTGGTSPHETVSQVFGRDRQSRVTVSYGRPYIKNPRTGEIRDVWGKLVMDDAKASPDKDAWRMGADEATTLITQKPIRIGGVAVPAGAYTLYMVPSETGTAKLAISTSVGQWGIPVDEKHDLARVDLAKSTAAHPYDPFTIALAKDPASGSLTLNIMWDTTQYSVPLELQK
jgi:hypothetical protein